MRKRLRSKVLVGTLVSVIALSSVAFVSAPVQDHLRAISLLLRISNPGQTGIAHYGTHPVEESVLSLNSAGDPIQARLYVPRGVPNPPAMVLVHGIHHLGMNEPRLTNFARAVAGSGIVALTPELPGIADYRVDPKSTETIGITAQELKRRTGNTKVGVFGLSFSGGLALLAAADPRYVDDISFVVAVGAHDDLSRVARFFVTNKIQLPDGTTESLQAHEYGPLVLVYSYTEDFFSPQDVSIAHQVLGLLLYEDVSAAHEKAKQLSAAGKAKMDLIFDHRIDAISAELLRNLDRHRAEMDAVSPAQKLGGLKADVLLLHGASDNIIPPSETLWLEREIRPDHLRATLITPVLSHVNMEDGPSIEERVAVIHFIARILTETRESAKLSADGTGGGVKSYFFPKDNLVMPNWVSDPWSH
jgi:pimeloyl-ACP methyl ester carboxylesterase